MPNTICISFNVLFRFLFTVGLWRILNILEPMDSSLAMDNDIDLCLRTLGVWLCACTSYNLNICHHHTQIVCSVWSESRVEGRGANTAYAINQQLTPARTQIYIPFVLTMAPLPTWILCQQRTLYFTQKKNRIRTTLTQIELITKTEIVFQWTTKIEHGNETNCLVFGFRWAVCAQ